VVVDAVALRKDGFFVLRKFALFFRHPKTKVSGFDTLQLAALCEHTTDFGCPKFGM
jgi:hypothetical protein